MQVTINLPEPAFKQGDVVRWGPLILLIDTVSVEGEWCYRVGKPEAWVEGDYRYLVVCQPGSRDLKGGEIRPGTVLVYQENTVASWIKTASGEYQDAREFQQDCCDVPDDLPGAAEYQEWCGQAQPQVFGKHAVKLEWDQPIIEADSMKNLGERWKAWDQRKGQSERQQ